MRQRLYTAAAVVFLAGLAVALGIYLGAGDETAGALDAIYSSKRYARDLQLYGGKASIVFDKLMRWFGGLWEGRRLAYTIAALSGITSAVLVLVARKN